MFAGSSSSSKIFSLSAMLVVVAALVSGGASAFQQQAITGSNRRGTVLEAVNRREALVAAGSLAGGMLLAGTPFEAVAAATTTTDAKKKKKDDAKKFAFNGVYKDPQHPDGYRILVGAVNKEGTMTLQDDPNGKTFNIPIVSKVDEESGKVTLTFDFSPKGGPKEVVATVGKDSNSITFPDGNSWKKETGGLVGVYVDGFAPYPKYRRIIRPGSIDGSDLAVEMVSGKKQFVIAANNGSKKNQLIVDFPGDKRCTGSTQMKKGVIKFPDGNVWTKV